MANNTFTPPSFLQILQARIQDYSAITSYFGYDLSVDPGSEFYLRASTGAAQLSVLYNLALLFGNNSLIDTAVGSALDAVANAYGLYRRSAISAQGAIQLITTFQQTILSGSTLTAQNGLLYQVITTGVYQSGQNIPILSVDQGSNTNLGLGTPMTWNAPNPGMQSTVSITVACTGGADAESDDTLRSRIYLTIQSPPQMGNSSQVISVSTSVDNIIQQSFVYSNFNGAGTQLIALTGYQTSSYIGRDIPHLPLDGYINIYGSLQLNPALKAQTLINSGFANGSGIFNEFTLENIGSNLSADSSAIYGQLPATVSNPFATAITTVNNYPSDLAISLTLPYPIGATPNGFGGGWLDTIPWPIPDGYYVQNYCQVISIQGTGTILNGQTGFGITIQAPSSGTFNTNNPYVSSQTYNNQTPIQGQTHIQWINRSDNQQLGWNVITAIILAAQDNGNQSWQLVLDTPLVFVSGTQDFYGNTGVAIGDFIFPASQNSQNYLNQILASYALLGPGQVTSDQGLLALGALRFPNTNTSFPATIGASLEKILEVNNNEIYQANVNPGNGIVVDGAIGIVYNAWNTAFSIPNNNSPPNIYVPRNIANYPSEFYNIFGIQ